MDHRFASRLASFSRAIEALAFTRAGAWVAGAGAAPILKDMNWLASGCCVLALFFASACMSRPAASPERPREASNGQVEKKPRKRVPIVAPPPAYGNKIVCASAGDARGAQASAHAQLSL